MEKTQRLVNIAVSFFLKMCLNWLTDAVEGMDAADDDDVNDI